MKDRFHLNISTSPTVVGNETHYIFLHDCASPNNEYLIKKIKKQNSGVSMASIGSTTSGEPHNGIMCLKKCNEEDNFETSLGEDVIQFLKFEKRYEPHFNITLHSISINEKSNYSNFYSYLSNKFSINYKHQPKTIRIVSIQGSNRKVFDLIANKLDLLGFRCIQYYGGCLFYWYDEKFFINFAVVKLSFLFDFTFEAKD